MRARAEPRASVRTQLVLWNAGAILLLLVGLGLACRFATVSVLINSVDRELDRGIEMDRMPRFVPFPPGGGHGQRQPPAMFPEAGGQPGFRGPQYEPGPFGPPPGGGPWGRTPNAESPFRPHLFGPGGRPAFQDETRTPWDQAGLNRALRGEVVHATVSVDGESLRVVSAPAILPEDRAQFETLGGPPPELRGAIQSAYPLREVNLAMAGLDMSLLLLIPVGMLAAGWLGSALTRRILARVQGLSAAAAAIDAEDFGRRLPVSGSDEFAELASTFNGMLGRLESAFRAQRRALEQQRRFTADASHELKTPLTIIKGCASFALGRASTEAGSKRTFAEIDHASDAMRRLVDDLLLLARADEGRLGAARVEILASEVLERAAAMARDYQRDRESRAEICVAAEPDVLALEGNEVELVRLFRNLLENALRHSPAGGRIAVTARPDAREPSRFVEIAVSDSGPGVAPERLPHLGERFYRVEASRARSGGEAGGTGLGLSICKGIVEAHGGVIAFESAPGAGLTVRVRLPRAPG